MKTELSAGEIDAIVQAVIADDPDAAVIATELKTSLSQLSQPHLLRQAYPVPAAAEYTPNS